MTSKGPSRGKTTLLNGFVFLSLFFCVSELVLLCSLNAFSVRFGLYVLVLDFEFSECVCIMSMLCLILNFLGLCLILNFFVEKKKNPEFFFVLKKTYSCVSKTQL